MAGRLDELQDLRRRSVQWYSDGGLSSGEVDSFVVYVAYV